MQKVYIVLKNNKQEGPYTLEELQQIDLKPTDLIWVEGRSAAWSYPSEIKELHAFDTGSGTNNQVHHQQQEQTASIRPTQKKETKKIFVSLPSGKQIKAKDNEAPPVSNIEEKAEALRLKILAHQTTVPETLDEIVETRLKRSMDEVAGDFANWAVQNGEKKKRSRTLKNKVIIACAVLMIVVLAAYFNLPVSESKIVSSQSQEQPLNNERAVTDDAETSIVFEPSAPAFNTETAAPKPNAGIASNPKESFQKQNNQHVVADDSPIQPSTIGETIDQEIKAEKKEDSVKEEPQKKKSIGEAIDGFFDKFKNKNKETAVGTAPANGEERKSTRRDEDAAATLETVDVSGQVKVFTNAPRENWMLGIKGQKLTLQNNSHVLIQSAWVTVDYYTEDENLIDTKRIEFKNIKPAQKITQPLPDHRLASYTTQQVTTATGTVQRAD